MVYAWDWNDLFSEELLDLGLCSKCGINHVFSHFKGEGVCETCANATSDYQQKKQSGDFPTKKLRWDILHRQMGGCYICKAQEWELKRAHDLHRIKPGHAGGKYTADNLVAVCRACHHGIEGMTLEQIEGQRRP